MRVALAEDSVLFREGLVRLLESAGFEVVGQADDAIGLLDVVGRAHPDVGPMLKKAGFRFLMDDEEEGFEFCQKMADIVQRPIQQETFDFGNDALITDVRRVFRGEPGLAIRIKPPAEALLFYRSAVGLAQDLRLLKARGPFRAVLAEVKERGKS